MNRKEQHSIVKFIKNEKKCKFNIFTDNLINTLEIVHCLTILFNPFNLQSRKILLKKIIPAIYIATNGNPHGMVYVLHLIHAIKYNVQIGYYNNIFKKQRPYKGF